MNYLQKQNYLRNDVLAAMPVSEVWTEYFSLFNGDPQTILAAIQATSVEFAN